MTKFLLALSFAGALFANTAKAQLGYKLSVSTDTYTPLTGGTSVNDTTRWDEENYKVPLGFNFKLGTSTISHFSLVSGSFAASDTDGTVISGFFTCDADLHDRGNAGGASSKSPIRYTTSGAAGSRIFKMEVYNAGFWDEWDMYITNNDSVCYQIWYYETSNIVELRFGPSNITHATDYFYLGSGPVIGFMKNIDPSNGSLDMLYYLNGSASSPTLDSTSSMFSVSGGLTSYPANGTVYRFTPPGTGVGSIAKELDGINVLNTVCTDYLKVANKNANKTTYTVTAMNGTNTNLNGTLQQGTNNIDLSALPAGVYILQCKNSNGAMQQRIVKQ
jgi:hypothetical protein